MLLGCIVEDEEAAIVDAHGKGVCAKPYERSDVSSICERVIQKNNPFIVAKTSKDIVSGHNDIWNPTLREWLASFVGTLAELNAAERRRDAAH